jgi:hypothetical protein
MIKGTRCCLAVILFVLFAISSCGGDDCICEPGEQVFVIQFQDGMYPNVDYDLCADAQLLESHPSSYYGESATMSVGNTGAGDTRVIILFDIAGALPAGADVRKAVMTLYVDDNYGDCDVTFSLFPLSSSWFEPEVTWNNRMGGISWSTPGGDYSTTAIATMTASGEKFPVDMSLPASLIEDWLTSNDENMGVILVPDSSVPGDCGLVFTTSDNIYILRRPRLTVHYTMP